MENLRSIVLTNVVKIFKIGKTHITVLNGLNFKCRERDFIIITGPSGSGKSTLLYLLGGLSYIDQGDISILNHNLSEMDEEDLAIFRSIYVGFVFQTGHLIDSLTVLENVMLPVELAQLRYPSECRIRALKLLEEFNLGKRENSLPVMLSGGEYQRTAFVRALILEPDLLLIDEPTSNQDNDTTQVIINKLMSLKAEITIIVVTHDRRIFPLADKIFFLDYGRLKSYKTV